MNDRQKQWIENKVTSLNNIMNIFFASGNVPVDEEWEVMLKLIDMICQKTNMNADVRNSMLSLVYDWEDRCKSYNDL